MSPMDVFADEWDPLDPWALLDLWGVGRSGAKGGSQGGGDRKLIPPLLREVLNLHVDFEFKQIFNRSS